MLRVRFLGSLDTPGSQQCQEHEEINVRLDSHDAENSARKKAQMDTTTLQLELDLIILKIDKKFKQILSEFSNETSLRLKIAAILQGNAIPTDQESRQEFVKQVSKKLQADYISTLEKLSNRFYSKMTGSKQNEIKARAHFAKKMQRFSNVQIKQDGVVNAILDHTRFQHRRQTELQEQQTAQEKQRKVKVLEKAKEFKRQKTAEIAQKAMQEYEEFEQKRREEQQKIEQIKAEYDHLQWQVKGELKIIKELVPIRCMKLAAEAIKEAKLVRVTKGPLQTSIWCPNTSGIWTKNERIIEEIATIVKDKVRTELQNEHKEIYNLIACSHVEYKGDFIKQIDNAMDAGDQAKKSIIKELKSIHCPEFVNKLNQCQNVFATDSAIYNYNTAQQVWEKLEANEAIQTFQSKTLNLDACNITTAKANADPTARLIGNQLLRGLGVKYFAVQITGKANDVKSFHTNLSKIANDWGATQLSNSDLIAPLRARDVRVIFANAGGDKLKKLAKRLLVTEPSPMLILLSADDDKRPPRLPKEYRLFKVTVPTEIINLGEWLISGTLQSIPNDEKPAGTVSAIENELQALTEIIGSFTNMKKWQPTPTQPTQEMIGVPLAAFMDELKQFCDEQDGIPRGLNAANLIRLLRRLHYTIRSPANQHSIQVYTNDGTTQPDVARM